MAEDKTFTYASSFPCSPYELYAWHSREGALERLVPPWENTSVIAKQGGIAPGGTTTLKLHAGPIPYQWHARHVEDIPGVMFKDIQHKGHLPAGSTATCSIPIHKEANWKTVSYTDCPSTRSCPIFRSVWLSPCWKGYFLIAMRRCEVISSSIKNTAANRCAS